MLLCFPWHAHMVGCFFEAMMAALGAVVQHFISFPGSACPFYWRHLESFGVVQKWSTPMYPLDPMVDHRFPHQNCNFAGFCGTPYGWTWLDNPFLPGRGLMEAVAPLGSMTFPGAWRRWLMAPVFSASSCLSLDQDFQVIAAFRVEKNVITWNPHTKTI